jgi:hypothetical protein
LSHRVISTILRHDTKQTSYKIALLRALNDVVLAYPDVAGEDGAVAVPLRMLAEAWIAYYWPFVAVGAPIDQGIRSRRAGKERNDLSFRPHLGELRRVWESIYGPSGPAGGWLLVEQMRLARKRAAYDVGFVRLYRVTLRRVSVAITMPIRYAGAGQWSVFAQPQPLGVITGASALPGSAPGEICLVVAGELWRAFRDVSLWVEALCIHEWSQFTERVSAVRRGEAYTLLTERPGNRLPVDWERNQVDLLMLEGARFECPWTGTPLEARRYDLDHIVPLSVYPFHELWNLVPADARFNRDRKRSRLPGEETMRSATLRLAQVYAHYGTAPALADALRDDVALRFARADVEPLAVALGVSGLVASIAAARNVPRF